MRTDVLIKSKSDTSEIIKLTAARLGMKVSEVENEIRYYWMDIDMMFTWNCGYGTYVEKFGHFLIFTNGVYPTAKEIEKQINKYLKHIRFFTINNLSVRRDKAIQLVQGLISRLILLNYSVELYKRDVLGSYPDKYKILNENYYKAVYARVGKRLGLSLAEFPITVSNPIQKVFVQKLRKQRLLHNPVIDMVKGKYKPAKVQQVRVPH
jgi:hypothetical protein